MTETLMILKKSTVVKSKFTMPNIETNGNIFNYIFLMCCMPQLKFSCGINADKHNSIVMLKTTMIPLAHLQISVQKQRCK